MKVKQEIDLEELIKYGFQCIVRKENIPFIKLCLENPKFTGISDTELQNYIDEYDIIDKQCYIVESDCYHYYNEGDYINIFDYSRRCQYYYLFS